MENPFLPGIVSNPKDDIPRLEYADWLDENAKDVECPCVVSHRKAVLIALEHGTDIHSFAKCTICNGSEYISDGKRERAEFIRVQCELTKLESTQPKKHNRDCEGPLGMKQPLCPRCLWVESNGKQLTALRQQEKKLFNKIWPQWSMNSKESHTLGNRTSIRILNKDGRSCDIQLDITKGFVSSVTCTASMWLGEKCNQCNSSGYEHSMHRGVPRGAHPMIPVDNYSGKCRSCKGKKYIPGLHEILYWREKQVCFARGPHHNDICSGGRVQSPNAQFTQDCKECKGTGFIKRSCPPTAQPIEVVSFTDVIPRNEGFYWKKEEISSGKTCDFSDVPMYNERWPDLQFKEAHKNTRTVNTSHTWGSHPDHNEATQYMTFSSTQGYSIR